MNIRPYRPIRGYRFTVDERRRERLDRAAIRQREYRRRKGLKNRPPGQTARPVRIVELGVVIPSVEAAARAVGGTCRPGNIRTAIKRKGRVGPFHYEWAQTNEEPA